METSNNRYRSGTRCKHQHCDCTRREHIRQERRRGKREIQAHHDDQ